MPAKERHPSVGWDQDLNQIPCHPSEGWDLNQIPAYARMTEHIQKDGATPLSQRRNVIPAQERHPSAGWDQDLKQIPCHPSEGWDLNQIPAYATMTSRIDLHHRAPPPKMVS